MTRETPGYTVEELAEKSGYAVGTIQDFTSLGILPKPAQWADPVLGRKGLYPESALYYLRHYKQLLATGRGKDWAVKLMKDLLSEAADVPLCEGRGQGSLEAHSE